MRKSVDHVNKVAEPPGEAAADELFELLHALMHLHRAQRQRALQDSALALTPMEGRVLGFFGRQPGATLSELVAHSGRDKGQLARLVAGLRERGLLEARADEADGRVTRLHPTAAARALHQSLARGARRQAAQAVAGFSADEQRQLLALLQRLRQNLEGAG